MDRGGNMWKALNLTLKDKREGVGEDSVISSFVNESRGSVSSESGSEDESEGSV